MFWNSEFMNTSVSPINSILRMKVIKLDVILLEQDILQEVKTHNKRLAKILTKPETISELVDRIVILTHDDTCKMTLYIAYVSSEILTSGPAEVLDKVVSCPEVLRKILFSLIHPPKEPVDYGSVMSNNHSEAGFDESLENVDAEANAEILPSTRPDSSKESTNDRDEPVEPDNARHEKSDQNDISINEIKTSSSSPPTDLESNDPSTSIATGTVANTHKQDTQQKQADLETNTSKEKQDLFEQSAIEKEPQKHEDDAVTDVVKDHGQKSTDEDDDDDDKDITVDLSKNVPEYQYKRNDPLVFKRGENSYYPEELVFKEDEDSYEPDEKVMMGSICISAADNFDDMTDPDSPDATLPKIEYMKPPELCESIDPKSTRVVPQKTALISKVIHRVHQSDPEVLRCQATRDPDSFSRLVDLLIHNIDASGCLEMLTTFISSTTYHFVRIEFCEIMTKLNLVRTLIDVMTLSDVEDKQRNACQLLCDIIVIDRQEDRELKKNNYIQGKTLNKTFDEILSIGKEVLLIGSLESAESIEVMLSQMFSHEEQNSTAIICGIKVLLTMLDQSLISWSERFNATLSKIEPVLVKHLHKFHNLLVSPPKLDPIKTSFGVIKEPLGYLRLQVINLIRVLIATNSPELAKKLIELRILKVIVDLFVEYSWNNLLHTQVEQALCSIVKNNRSDEELYYNYEMLNCIEQARVNAERKCMSLWSLREEDNSHGVNNINQSQQYDHEQHSQSQPNNACDQEQQIKSQRESINSHEDGKENEKQPESDQTVNPDGKVNCNNTSENDKEKEDQKRNEDQRREKDIAARLAASRALLSHLLCECDLIRKLELGNGADRANHGHIIQMVNTLSINSDLDVIKAHLNEMEKNRPELYFRWNKFLQNDVAHFKNVTFFYDLSQDGPPRTPPGMEFSEMEDGFLDQLFTKGKNIEYQGESPLTNDVNSTGQKSIKDDEEGLSIVTARNFDEQLKAYNSFVMDTVLPSVNPYVLPKVKSNSQAKPPYGNLT